MNTHADKTQENKSQSVSHGVSQIQSGSKSTFQFIDNRPEAIAQRKLQELANNSSQAKRAAQLQAMANNYSAQLQHPIQKKASPEHSDKPNVPDGRRENNTGLPDNLKSGIENLSGYSMDDVKVHYNSDKPAQLQAHAYAQGTDIHLASGQEKHLPHEAWHVVQQKQGRVKPTFQMKGKVNVNDDVTLEKEADEMGAKALQLKPKENKSRAVANTVTQKQSNVKQGFGFVDNRSKTVLQRLTPPANIGEARTSHMNSLVKNKKDRDTLWKYVKEGVNQNSDMRLKNSAELVIGGHMKVFAVSPTGDSTERVNHNGQAGKKALFPRANNAADPGDITSSFVDYNYLDLDDNTHIGFIPQNAGGWNIGPQKLIAVVDASEMDKKEFYGTLRHEAQHATDDHGNSAWESYQTEFRAYFYQNNWDESPPFGHSFWSRTFEDTVAGRNVQFQTGLQLEIFKGLYNEPGLYPYVKNAWDNDIAGFRAQVIGYSTPDTLAINKYNSIRIQNFNQAIAALPGGINDKNDVNVTNLYNFIADPSRLQKDEAGYILDNTLIMQNIESKLTGLALFKIKMALQNIKSGRVYFSP